MNHSSGSQTAWLVYMFIPCACGRWEMELKTARMRIQELNCDKRGFVRTVTNLGGPRGRASEHDTTENLCTHNMLHNQTHTLFFLHQMNQFLQNFIQHPEEAETRGKAFIICIISTNHLHTAASPPAQSIPALDVEVLPQHQVFEGGMPGERWDDSQQVSIQTYTHTHTNRSQHTSLEYERNASSGTLSGAYVKTHSKQTFNYILVRANKKVETCLKLQVILDHKQAIH